MADLVSLYKICLETGLSGQDATGTVEPDILGHYFAAPYAVLEPEHCFVLTMAGEIIGYIVGTPDTKRFESVCEENWWPALRKRYPVPESVDSSRTANMIRAIHHPETVTEAWLDRYPAHLHINILPPGQGRGYGRALIETFCGHLRGKQVNGVHFGVSKKNHNAIAFYECLGFTLLGTDSHTVVMGMRLRDNMEVQS